MASPGMDQQRLADLENVIRADIKAGMYHGAVIKVARAGKVALEAAIGAADAVRRTDPKRRGYRQLVQDEILTPLKMNDTSFLCPFTC
jgi:hypothetical protein